MKSLALGVVVILVLGIGGFAFRHVVETTGGPQITACTAEAKLCPDGSAVGRVGPSCEFAPCAFPNVTFADANLSFALPEGYQLGVQEPGADGNIDGMLGFYQKQALSGYHYITIYQFPIAEDETANDVIVANTTLSPSGEQVSGINKFDPVLIQGKTFQHIVIERFEGQVVSAYYLVRDTDVLRFDVLEKDVTNWTESELDIHALPEHKALEHMLTTVE